MFVVSKKGKCELSDKIDLCMPLNSGDSFLPEMLQFVMLMILNISNGLG